MTKSIQISSLNTLLAWVCVAFIFGSANSYAQLIAESERVEEIQVVSASRQPQSLSNTNAAISILDDDELFLIAHTHYQESLNRLPGVNVHRNSGQESLISIRSPVLTGAGACGAFLIAENGIPLRSSGFCNVNEMFDAHTENAQQIEVVRGPASAFWGSNSMHGLINVVLPEPGEVGQLRLELGPRGSYRSQAALGTDHGGFKQTLLLTGVSEEGFREESGVDQQKASWLYSYTSPGGIELNGGFTYANLNQETAGFLVGAEAYKDSDLRETNTNPEAYRDSRSARLWSSLSLRYRSWDLVITPYLRDVDMSFIQHFLPGQPIEDFSHQSIGAQTAAYRVLDSGASLALGLDFEFTAAALRQTQPNPTLGSFFLINTIPQGKHYDYEVSAQQVAGFVSYEQEISEGWNLSLGARLESISYDYTNLMIDGRTDEFDVPCALGCRYNRPADRSDSFVNLSPKFALSYTLNNHHSFYARIQRGFRAPQATELYRLQNDQSVASLESVELDSYELAVEGAAAGWSYAASLYFMNKENEIFQNSARENLNDNHTQHRGLELEVSRELTENLAVDGVFNLAKHSYENPLLSGATDIEGNEVDTAPNRFGNLRLSWQVTPSLNSELEWVMMGSYFTNPENSAKYEGHNLFNIRTQYEINDGLSFSLNLMNIGDERYAERADWTTFTGDRYFPGEGRRAFLALNWNFK